MMNRYLLFCFALMGAGLLTMLLLGSFVWAHEMVHSTIFSYFGASSKVVFSPLDNRAYTQPDYIPPEKHDLIYALQALVEVLSPFSVFLAGLVFVCAVPAFYFTLKDVSEVSP